MTDASQAVLVVPCYNEERRLDREAFIAFARLGQATLLLVDDGSTDATAELIRSLQNVSPERVRLLLLTRNQGKAEAVRRGLNAALEQGASIVGYADADLSTPFDELSRLLSITEQGGAKVVLGSRVALLGSEIERTFTRHYLGRVFATVASLLLEMPVYDTQCGAKFFRSNAALSTALAEPFHSAWAFDVELLGRLLIGAPGVAPLSVADFLEVPLQHWCDVGGSRLSSTAMARVAFDLLLIRRALARRKREATRSQ